MTRYIFHLQRDCNSPIRSEHMASLYGEKIVAIFSAMNQVIQVISFSSMLEHPNVIIACEAILMPLHRPCKSNRHRDSDWFSFFDSHYFAIHTEDFVSFIFTEYS